MHAQSAHSSQTVPGIHPVVMKAASSSAAWVSSTSPGNRIVLLFDDFPIAHRRLKTGEHLFRAGDAFQFLYILNAGFAKTCYLSEDGCEQTTGFHLRGDILGLDAIGTGTYAGDAIALDVCDVMMIPFESILLHGQRNPDLVRELYSAFSSEIRSDRELMMRIGSLPAEGRVAAFLLEMSSRFGARGFSSTDLQLRLTRQEIGSLLGLKLETVSRALSHFAKLGLIDVYLRDISLRDIEGLKALVAHPSGLEQHAAA